MYALLRENTQKFGRMNACSVSARQNVMEGCILT